MNLGEKLKQARLAAGMTQKQLCGDRITRNMLSLIENGAATPSLETLCYLAKTLNRPLSDFLEEAQSSNQALILQARTLPADRALELLRDYCPGDLIFDPEYYLLAALHAMELAEEALAQGRRSYCRELLDQARSAGEKTPYFQKDLQRRLLLLEGKYAPQRAQELVAALPDSDEPMLRATAALQQNDPETCRGLLGTLASKESQFLRAESFFAEKDYKNAAICFEELDPDPEVFQRLEICYRELGDFERAYHYACLRR